MSAFNHKRTNGFSSEQFLYLNETRDRPVVRSHAIRKIERDFVNVAPAPSFGRIIAFDNRVSGCVKVLRRVAIGGIVTAPNMAARTTQT
jgi:hypothetical protein